MGVERKATADITGKKLGFKLSLGGGQGGEEEESLGIIMPMDEDEVADEGLSGAPPAIQMLDDSNHSSSSNASESERSLTVSMASATSPESESPKDDEVAEDEEARRVKLPAEKVVFSRKLQPLIASLSASYGFSEMRCAALLAAKVGVDIVLTNEDNPLSGVRSQKD